MVTTDNNFDLLEIAHGFPLSAGNIWMQFNELWTLKNKQIFPEQMETEIYLCTFSFR